MYDSDDDGALMNELLISIFVPAAVVFSALFASFRLVLDDFLLSVGLVQIEPAHGYGAISAGYGRMVLLMVLTAVIVLPYIGLYMRFIRKPLRERGIV